jgi:hypothetical protein
VELHHIPLSLRQEAFPKPGEPWKSLFNCGTFYTGISGVSSIIAIFLFLFQESELSLLCAMNCVFFLRRLFFLDLFKKSPPRRFSCSRFLGKKLIKQIGWQTIKLAACDGGCSYGYATGKQKHG